jgi:hypothetical protein
MKPLKNMSKKMNTPKSGEFCWNELITANVPAAKKFYSGLLGWKTKAFGKGMDYTIILKGSADKNGMGGMMKCPKPGKARAMDSIHPRCRRGRHGEESRQARWKSLHAAR